MKMPTIFQKTFSHGRLLVALASLFSVHPLFAQKNTYTETVNGVSFTMVRVQGGTFTMGCTAEQEEYCYFEKPAHQVLLSDYSIGETEVTQAMWRAVMGNNPSHFNDCDECPVEQVSWEEVQGFIQKLNTMTGKAYRLPTEAEWEFAARGGIKSRGYFYSGGKKSGKVAWCKLNSFGKTHPVKKKKANELGLYDMSGNVWEWCQDIFGYYSSDSQTNPTGPEEGAYRVWRGGSWRDDDQLILRSHCEPFQRFHILGFRLASR